MIACVVEHSFIAPYCVSQCDTSSRIQEMMKDSSTFDNVGVKEMGLRSLLMSVIGVFFGTGTTSADFHIDGK